MSNALKREEFNAWTEAMKRVKSTQLDAEKVGVVASIVVAANVIAGGVSSIPSCA